MPLNPHGVTETELIQGCIRKDRQSQKALFKLFAPKMLSVCRRYARHHMEAEDILQDGFIKVFSNIESFKFNGSFEGWVRRIMVNTALKLVSKSAFKKETIGVEEYQDNHTDAEIFAKLSADDILNLVEQLPDGYRVVFNLYVIEGFSHRDIAEELQIEESTSRSQLVKARRILQKKIIDIHKIAV
jgi:RNA polymerase sigma-70 factor (ECF subfamily)